jgi:hypothetical protein
MTATELAPPTPWEIVERHLIASGALSPEGIGRRAQPRRCPSCRQPVLVGLDADTGSVRADADPAPVTALGELLAQLEGRRTFALVRNAGRLVLDYRDAGRIRYRPAGTDRLDVLVEHRCPSRTVFPQAESNLVRYASHIQLNPTTPAPF